MIIPFLCSSLVREIADGTASEKWPEALGTIVRSSVIKEDSKSTRYTPEVEYTYSVDGQELSGNQYHFCLRVSSDRGAVEDMLVGFEPNAEVQVYYDPSSPGKSVLVPGVDAGRVIVLAVLFLTELGALVFVLIYLRRFIKLRALRRNSQ